MKLYINLYIIILFTYRIITRSLRFGFINEHIAKEFNDNLDNYINEIKKAKKSIMKSPIFRRIDRINIYFLCMSYRLFRLLYTVEQKIRKKRKKD